MIVTKTPGPYLAIAAVIALLASAGSLPAGRFGAADAPGVVVSEIHPAGSSASYAADWFEVTNTGTTTVDITGWKFDDNSNSFDNAVALRGITSLPPGASAIFLEGRPDVTTDAALIANFPTAWFGSATPPAGTLIGTYDGSGVGMSGSGDAVNLFNAAGARVTGISFGAAAGTALATFDNSAGLGGATLPLPIVTTLSADKVNGAFVSFNGTEVGSPGARIIASPLTGIDPSTNGDPTTSPNTQGFIAVKEINPQGLFQTGIDFVAGTATNGSASTVNSVDLFDPALLGLTDIADVYALSNLPGLTGSQKNNLLVLSQEEGVIVNVDRGGAIASTLTITDPRR